MPLPLLLTLLLAQSEIDPERQRIALEVRKQLEADYYRQDLGTLAWDQVDLSPALSVEDFYSSLNRVLAALKDEHTGVDSPRIVQEQKTGKRLGLGLTARLLEERLTVLQVQEGSPAEAQGIARGWTIQSINGSVVPKDGEAFVPYMRQLNIPRLCEQGPVRLEARDQLEAAKDLSISCSEVNDRDVRQANRRGEVLHLRFGRFNKESADWFLRSLAENADARKLILDLRGNGGGERSALLRISGSLMGRESVGRSTARRGRVTEWRGAGKAQFSGPIVVLTDELTASAGEILAGALQEKGLAKVMGRKTLGSVLAMVRRPLPGGGQLRISVEDFVLPSGRRLEGEGVKPDRETTLTVAALQAGEDALLEAALAELR